jgi:serine/threonine protein kinase
MEFTIQNVCGLLIRSKLMSPDEVKTMYQRWLAAAKDGDNLGLFGRWLAANHYVTDYQAALITKGHADDFFLNQYKILDRLGRGRMAGVYKAIHKLGQIVAIKVLPPSKAKDPTTLARFLREARLAMRLKHPNVVRAFQVGEANGLRYLVMEYLEGETLDEVLQRRKQLPPTEAVRLVHQVLLGLQHIHEQGLVHRDLKPSNLMLVPGSGSGQGDTTVGSTVKILDMGLGRALFDENSPAAPVEGGALNNQLTAEGVILGTPDYLSPEQARDPRVTDIRADIYSLGCVLYHMVAGQPPFPDTNIISQMVRHATEVPKALNTFNAAVPDGLQQILNWMIAKDASQRYPTPERAAQALQVFLAAGSAPAKSLEAEPQMRKYLTWLETSGEAGDASQSGSGKAAVTGKSASPPAAAPPKTPPALKNPPLRTPPTPVPPARKHHAKKQKRKHLAGRAGSPMDFDVELVPATISRREAGPPQRRGLTRRDWLLLGIGAGAVVIAAGVGIGLRWLNEMFDDDPDSENEPSK